MRIKAASVLMFTLCVLNPISRSETSQRENHPIAPQTFTLYPPHNRATDAYDETRACFSFKTGQNKSPDSTDWDLGYGFITIANEDWLMVGTTGTGKRTVIQEMGAYKWSDSFETVVLEPLPQLKKGESRQITVDSSGDTHLQWAKSTNLFVKAAVGHMHLVHVKDDQADFYVLFRIEELQQGDHCTISWKRIPTPERVPEITSIIKKEGIKNGRLLARKVENGVDNYPYASFSFEVGGNGPEVRRLCRNDWDIIFGNSPMVDAFDVSMATDDRSRIRDLGMFNWDDEYEIPRLAAYEEPEREPSVKAVEGHLYLVHTRDTDSDLYSLFRVEKLEPRNSVEISWKVIPQPKVNN